MIKTLFVLLLAIVRPSQLSFGTSFAAICYSETADGQTVTWGYTAANPTRFIGYGYDFVTEAGAHPDAFTTPVDGVDIVYLSPIYDVGDASGKVLYGDPVTIILDPRKLPECETVATVTPCPAKAIDAATGAPYCYTPTLTGLIPLPPPLQ